MTNASHHAMRLLNAHGPYEHGIWNSGEISIESVQRLSGTLLFFRRSFELVDKISEKLLEVFSYEELKGKSILDIGCYDGWILHQLDKKFSFSRAVGVEPRKKNIQKGIFARTYYGINSNIEVHEGSINSLDSLFPEISFDIVLCLGTIHHVESTPEAIRNIAKKSSDILVLDSMVIDRPKKDAKRILNLLNLKDIVYLESKYEWATAAYKFESPYFDGSAAEAQIVNVPEERLIRMSLSLLGFQVLAAIAPEKNFYNKKYQKLRGVKESFIFARKDYTSNLKESAWKAKVQLYESIFTFGLLELEILSYWINLLKLQNLQNKVSVKSLVQKNWLKSKILFHYSKNPTSKWLTLFVRGLDISKVDLEILSAISRSPRDKILLELAKHGIINKRYEVAIEILERILDSEGADWRSFYRAAYLLSIIHLITNNSPRQSEFKELLLISNSDWPLTDAEGLNWALRNKQ
jgi:2-polyprenyl-3-methyl-5-hydroxy-6-metoxy-1,4-benzoquinol methylase